MDRLIRFAHVEGIGVGVRKNGDGADLETPRGADDAAGDLAAIGDEQRADHRRRHRSVSTVKLMLRMRQRPSTLAMSNRSTPQCEKAPLRRNVYSVQTVARLPRMRTCGAYIRSSSGSVTPASPAAQSDHAPEIGRAHV